MGSQPSLIDTCSYLRLAEKIPSLLGRDLTREGFCILVLKELDFEYNRNPAIQHKFQWVKNPEYLENRRNNLFKVNAQEEVAITRTVKFVHDTAASLLLPTSHIDELALSYGIELGMPIITDDGPMTELAEAMEFKMVMSSLQVLHKMATNNSITMELVKEIVGRWIEIDDTPNKNCKSDCEKLFGSDFIKSLAA